MANAPQFLPLAEAKPPFYVGVDLGGTNIKIGLVDDLGRPLAKHSVPTEVPRGAEDASKRMGEGILQIIRDAGLTADKIGRVGLGSPGTMDIPTGMLVRPCNLHGWNNFPLRDRVSHHCGLPVTFANDAAAAAYGEFWVGSGRVFHSMVLFTLGTGIGCGIIVGDLSIDGENSHGAECGHIIIDCREGAAVCSCGQPGHLEAYASATGVIRRTKSALAAGRTSSVSARVAAGEDLTPLMLSQEAEKGDALSMDIILETAAYLGVGTVSLMHTIDPNGVVFAGAMTFGGHASPVGQRFLARIKDEVNRRAFKVLAERTTIDFAALGGDAGFIGAAGLARLDHQRKKA
ncbi:MAG: ROK family protein [Pirellulales bacterium]